MNALDNPPNRTNPTSAAQSPATGSSIASRVFAALSSFGLACILLMLLLYLTWKGTLAQADLGLKEAQERYFDSWFATDQIGGMTIRFIPGAYLVLALLTMNLILGGVVRIRKSSRTIGVLIAHFGILLIVAAGFVKFHQAIEGYVDLEEGQSKSEFVSYHDWEIAIDEPIAGGKAKEWIIPAGDFIALRPQDRAVFRADDLPFDLQIASVHENSLPKPAADPALRGDSIVDGFVLENKPLDPEAERNSAGCIATMTPKAGGEVTRAILWGFTEYWFAFEAGGRSFRIDLRKKHYTMPFAIRLEKFHTSTHPGIQLTRDFSSDVTRTEDGSEHALTIKMNEPMRTAGYIVYQSKYRPLPPPPGSADTPDNVEYASILAVVNNPSDQWPLIACIVIAIGLVIHFGSMLFRYAKMQARKRASA